MIYRLPHALLQPLYCIQLYHRIAGAVDLRGRDVLEVGCGRGGGAAYVARAMQPRTVVGLDYTRESIAFCRRHYAVPGLTFVQGDAEALQFPDASFDAVLAVLAVNIVLSITDEFGLLDLLVLLLDVATLALLVASRSRYGRP